MGYRGIMAHLISHYPDAERFWEVAEGLISGGAAALELQFPFSDPTADGPAIQEASSQALSSGFTLEKGFDYLLRLRSMTDCPLFVMTYANIPMVRGIEQFVKEAHRAGVTGLIVPDLPPGDDEGLYEIGRRVGVEIVPVVVPELSEARRRIISDLNPRYLYVALRRGTTGRETEIGEEQLQFLDWARSNAEQIMAGFGIRRPEQVDALRPLVDYAVVGSAIVNRVARVVGTPKEGLLRRTVLDFLKGIQP